MRIFRIAQRKCEQLYTQDQLAKVLETWGVREPPPPKGRTMTVTLPADPSQQHPYATATITRSEHKSTYGKPLWKAVLTGKPRPKAQYLGDCIGGFDGDGNGTAAPFQDATEFSQREAEARGEDGNLKGGFRMDRRAFLELAEFPQGLLNRDMEFYRLPKETLLTGPYRSEVLVAYDLDSGTHHFFA